MNCDAAIVSCAVMYVSGYLIAKRWKEETFDYIRGEDRQSGNLTHDTYVVVYARPTWIPACAPLSGCAQRQDARHPMAGRGKVFRMREVLQSTD